MSIPRPNGVTQRRAAAEERILALAITSQSGAHATRGCLDLLRETASCEGPTELDGPLAYEDVPAHQNTLCFRRARCLDLANDMKGFSCRPSVNLRWRPVVSDEVYSEQPEGWALEQA